MIERKFVKQNIKEFQIKEFIEETLSRVGLSAVKLQRTPLGEKIIVVASRPGLVVGRAGANIASLTQKLKTKFKLENPQIEIEEVKQLALDASIIAEMIVNSLERFGTQRFKGIGHKAMNDVMTAGAKGVEIIISGKIPGSRAKTWRFFNGYLKKCGEVSKVGVLHAIKVARLKSGVVGVRVSIMPPSLVLPDEITPIVQITEDSVDPKLKKEMEAVAEGESTTEQEADILKKMKSAPKTSSAKGDAKKLEKETTESTPKKTAMKKKSTKTKTEEKITAEALEKPVKDIVNKAEAKTPAKKKKAPTKKKVAKKKTAKKKSTKEGGK